jgi:hypothetical protein
VVLDTAITEAGSGGHVVRVLNGELAQLHETWVGDPRLTGLDQPDWGAVHLVGRALVHDTLQAEACTPPRARPPVADPGGLGTVYCPKWGRVGWPTSPGAAPVPTADGLPIVAWYHPEATQATEAVKPWVLLDDRGVARWVEGPKVAPEWAGDAFGTRAEGSDWVVLFP